MTLPRIDRRFLMMLAAACALAGAAPALAHHSFAMFDRTREIVLVGAVREFQWTNPHSWIEIQVPNAKGGVDKWGVECTSPAVLVRAGWKSTSLKPGDVVTITIHPLRSGELGGSMVSVKTADGRTLTDKSVSRP